MTEQQTEAIFESYHVLELSDEIERRLANPPDGRNRERVREWKRELNLLIERANLIAKHKIYNHVR